MSFHPYSSSRRFLISFLLSCASRGWLRRPIGGPGVNFSLPHPTPFRRDGHPQMIPRALLTPRFKPPFVTHLDFRNSKDTPFPLSPSAKLQDLDREALPRRSTLTYPLQYLLLSKFLGQSGITVSLFSYFARFLLLPICLFLGTPLPHFTKYKKKDPLPPHPPEPHFYALSSLLFFLSLLFPLGLFPVNFALVSSWCSSLPDDSQHRSAIFAPSPEALTGLHQLRSPFPSPQQVLTAF